MTPPARNGPAGAVTPGDPVLRPYPVIAKEATESRLREVERLVAGATTMDGIRGPHWGRRGCGSAIRGELDCRYTCWRIRCRSRLRRVQQDPPHKYVLQEVRPGDLQRCHLGGRRV